MKLKNKDLVKTLILLRHAHRDKDLGTDFDNGLSKKGLIQSAALLNYFRQEFYIEPMSSTFVIASSPKKRCQETVLPIGQAYSQALITLNCLDEGEPLETKIDQFVKWVSKRPEKIVIACSHGDILPILIEHLTGQIISLKKGAWAHLVLGDNDTNLVKVIQNFL